MLGCAVFLGLAVVTTLWLVLAHSVKKPPFFDKRHICTTHDCLEHARQILATLDRSKNPCSDFHDYVCGVDGSETRGPRAGHRLARVYTDKIIRGTRNPPNLTAEQTSSTVTKIYHSLALCLERSDRGSPTALLSFMKERGLVWPHSLEPEKSVTLMDVLGVLLDLSVNWRVSLWFDVRVTYTEHRGDGGHPLVILDEPGHVPLLRMEQIAGLDESAYASAVREVTRFLTSTHDTDKGVELPLAAIEALRQDETKAREAILSALGGDDVFDVLLSLRGAQSPFPIVSPQEWVRLQDKYIRPVVGTHVLLEKILVLNQPLLTAVVRLMGEIPADRIFNFLGWMFAYSYSWIVNNVFDDIEGSASPTRGVTRGLESNFSTYVMCLTAVQESFSVTSIASLFNTELPSQDRQEVASVLDVTAEQLVSIVRASEGAPNATKTESSAKIVALTRPRLFPLRVIEDFQAIDSLYASFPSPDAAQDFYQSWLELRKALRANLMPGFSGDVVTAKPRWYAEEITYVYSMNLMFIGLVTIIPPSHSWHGSRGMTYAGLGFQLARQLVKSMDQRGRLVRHGGESTNWWGHKQFCKFDRAESPKHKASIRDLFALTVAFSAMKNVSTVDASAVRLKLLEEWTPEQTFYVSYCSHFCGQYGARDMCDLAMNLSEFRKAFMCQAPIAVDHGCLFI